MSRPSSREAVTKLPEGFGYRPELINQSEEAALLASVRGLPFREFEFHGYTGRRRVGMRSDDGSDDEPEGPALTGE